MPTTEKVSDTVSTDAEQSSGRQERTDTSTRKRLLWFMALWAGGLCSVLAVSYTLRFWIGP